MAKLVPSYFLCDGEGCFDPYLRLYRDDKIPEKSKFEFGPMNTYISGNAIEGPAPCRWKPRNGVE